MKVMAEKEAERFLSLNGFDVINTKFVSKEEDLKNVLKEMRYPVVLKVSGEKIIHKKKIGGVKMNIYNYNQALITFRKLKGINESNGVLIQEQIKEKAYFVGLKKTSEFGYVLAFGKGGSNVEKERKINFRVCGVKGMYDLSDEKKIRNVFTQLCELSHVYSRIRELDINPLMLKHGRAFIVDARIVFD